VGIVQRLEFLRERNRDERGAELVEFALVIVLLVVLIYGLLTYGLIFGAKASLSDAASDATRAALATYKYDLSIGDSSTLAQTNATAAAQKTVQADMSWLTTVNCGSTTPTGAAPLECSTSYPATTATCGGTLCFAINVTYDYADAPIIPTMIYEVATPSALTADSTVVLAP
jgi:Flp pilus assembly protein TadG